MPRWHQAPKLYPQLPMLHYSRLPFFMAARDLEVRSDGLRLPVRVDPPAGGKHRVFARCTCNRWIPFGRLNQHWPSCQRKAQATAMEARS